MLDHERLRVYQLSIRLAALSLRVIATLPRGSAKLADQLWRSSTSISSNIAEGVGKRSMAERRSYYDHSRGSAFESAAHLDIVRLLNTGCDKEIDEGKQMLVEIVKMLTVMMEKCVPSVVHGQEQG